MNSTPNKREQQKQATHRLLLDVAYAQYAEHGLATTTLMVAQAAGVSHGTVFAHFPTADALLCCVLDELGASVGSALHGLWANGVPLPQLLSAHIAALTPHEAIYAKLALAGDALPKAARGTLTTLQSTVAHHLLPALEKTPACTNLCIPPPLIFNTWLGLLHHYLRERDLFAPGQSVLEQRGPDLIEAFTKLAEGPTYTERT